LTAAIRQAIATLPDLDPVLVALVEEELRGGAVDQDRRRQEWATRQAAVARKLAHVVSAIQEVGPSPTLLQELTRLEREKAELLEEGRGLERAAQRALRLPTVAEVRELAADAFDQLAVMSQEFARLLRRLIPTIVVKPYRLLDGGHPVLRAHFTLALAPLVAEGLPPALRGTLQRTLVVDLFDPPEREAFRVPVMELTANGLKQRAIAWELGISQAAVQHAAALTRRLRQAGANDPYVALEAPPADYHRLRRHRHRRYRFEPLALPARGQS
jgi:hypothetical protein